MFLLVLAHPGCPDKIHRAVKRLCVCVRLKCIGHGTKDLIHWPCMSVKGVSYSSLHVFGVIGSIGDC